MAIEIDAFEKLAISKGATSLEIHQAMESHRADPEIRKAIKERYKLLWDVLFDAGTESFADETLESLQIVRKPN